jgi:hypothetical protein
MKTRDLFLAFVVALFVAGPTGAGPQSPGTPVEIEDEEGLAAMRGRIFAFVEALVGYTKDARLSEVALGDILDHYDALDEIHDGEDDGRVVERAFQDGRYDFEVIVGDPAYAEWCRGRGLEPEPFFRSLLRLEALRMRKEGLAGLERALAELPEQEAELEKIREKVGEEAYREGRAALAKAAAMVEETRELMARLPEPSAEETALLGQHAARIEAVLGEDELE